MDLSQQKQEFSKAYVKAVAAAAGYATQEPSVDDDSVDLGLVARGGNGSVRSPRLEMQLKCTARHLLSERTLNYPLPLKNYDDLRPVNLMVPRILVVVTVPEDVSVWIEHSEDQMLLKHCGYWCSLRGFPATENSSTVTVNVPRTQLFNVSSVVSMMDRVSQEQLP